MPLLSTAEDPPLRMNAVSLLRGCRSGPGKNPEPGLFRGGKRKGEWACTAPRGDLEGGSSDVSFERLSQGEGKRRAPKSELIAAALRGNSRIFTGHCSQAA